MTYNYNQNVLSEVSNHIAKKGRTLTLISTEDHPITKNDIKDGAGFNTFMDGVTFGSSFPVIATVITETQGVFFIRIEEPTVNQSSYDYTNSVTLLEMGDTTP